MDVQPVNSVERSFTIMVVVLALVGFSYLLGSISSSITQLRGMREEEAKEFWKLRRYLKMNSIPQELAMRVRRYLEHEYHRHCQGSTPRNVKLMDFLSEQLQRELQHALAVPHLKVHPLLGFMTGVSEVTIQRLAISAISPKHYAQADIIFYPTEVATGCFFVVSGRLKYKRVDARGTEKKEWVDQCEDWISEPALWTPKWIHLGVLVSTHIHTHLLMVDATKFVDIVLLNPVARQIVRNYARNYIKYLNQIAYQDLSDITQGDKESHNIEELIYAGDEGIHHFYSSANTSFQTKVAVSHDAIRSGLTKAMSKVAEAFKE